MDFVPAPQVKRSKRPHNRRIGLCLYLWMVNQAAVSSVEAIRPNDMKMTHVWA